MLIIFHSLPAVISLYAYKLITIIVSLTAAFGYINFRFLKLPSTIGIMIISLLASLAIIGLGQFNPELFAASLEHISAVDFHTALMKVMLSFLLFAGAIHIDIHRLRSAALPIIAFSTVGVLMSTFIVAALTYLVSGWLGLQVAFCTACCLALSFHPLIL